MENIDKFFKKEIENFTFISSSQLETEKFAKEFAKSLTCGEIIALNGELGSGKTVFMKGLASFFGIEKEVSSPTFTIVNEYKADKFNIFHFDVYRIKNSLEFENTIGTDYFYQGVSVIEWGEIIEDILPQGSIIIDIIKEDVSKRCFNVRRKSK